jgi:hypothetical protein
LSYRQSTLKHGFICKKYRRRTIKVPTTTTKETLIKPFPLFMANLAPIHPPQALLAYIGGDCPNDFSFKANKQIRPN